MKRSKIYKALVVFILTIFLSGCWDIKDVNKRSIPLVMGISKEGDKNFELTLQIPIPKSENQVSRTVTERSGSIAGALGKIQTNSENAMDYSQIQLIVIQKNLARNEQEFKNLIKFLMGSEEIPSRALVAITSENVKNVLSNINDKLGVHASAIYDYFYKGSVWSPELFSTPIWAVYRSLFLSTKDIAIPSVRSGKDTVLVFEGSYIFKRGKLTDRISPEETQLINMFNNKKIKGKIETLGFASVVITDNSISSEVSLKNDIAHISSTLDLEIHVLEKEDGVTNKQIEKKLEKVNKERFYTLLSKTQKNNTDIFGFGQQFQNVIPYPKLYHWRNEYYPHLKMKFKVKAKIE
ncbi:Ger(x)C family spore germination protein [Fictibacillus nanhaiensis]|uniref:Ger(x)C family spore germination protein n=1 Tax=Fictibacillus nanhaiensis TaxID=742169 RepID=UPI002E1C2C7B|nr:Ger(x)C family spore germination protein [Fictibacillus nanhaiensis]MED1865799.1 Ger(x)C family spore germination protein [Fictibacillus nanhaiensis]